MNSKRSETGGRRNSLSHWAMLLTATCMVTGCGERNAFPTTSISGVVTLDGELINHGIITFVPADSGHGSGGSGPIIDGAYQLKEVPTGTVGFTFSASQETGKLIDGPGGQKEPERINPVPSRYRTEGVIEEIGDGGQRDFELTSK